MWWNERDLKARQPVQRCGVDGCDFQTKRKVNLKRHQARMHGIGDVDAEELRRKHREYLARQPVQRCGVDGCDFQNKYKHVLKQHQARVHGIGDVEAVEELMRKQAKAARERMARLPVQRCGVDGCEFQTKRTSDLKQHQSRLHGGDVDAAELKMKQWKWKARQAAQICGVTPAPPVSVFQTPCKQFA
jgi:hypothetical protein